MDILKTLDKNTKILNISNCGLKGVLDLKEFKYLEELYCSNNEITEIINLLRDIKYLGCSNNKLQTLEIYEKDDKYKRIMLQKLICLSKKIKYLDCRFNKLEKLQHNINKKIKYPKTLTHLELGYRFNKEINNLPDSIIYLRLYDNEFYKKINQKNIIEAITELKLSYEFNGFVNKLPKNLTQLTFYSKYNGRDYLFSKFNNHTIDNLPRNLTYLTLSSYSYFNQKINNLPNSLTHLLLGDDFDQSIDYLPNSLTHLIFQDLDWRNSRFGFGQSFNNQTLNNLPQSLIYLELKRKFNNSSNHLFDNLPQSLLYLEFKKEFNQSIINLPNSIKEISIERLQQYNLFDKKYHLKIKKIYIGFDNMNDIKNLPNTISKIEIYDEDEYNYINYIPEFIEEIIIDEKNKYQINEKYHSKIIFKNDIISLLKNNTIKHWYESW